MPVRPMLLHRMALVSSRLFCKNLGNLQEFFWANGLPPPLAENCPYAYGEKKRENVKALSIVTGTRCGTVSNEIELHLKSFGIKQENLDQIQSTLPY